MPAGKRTVTPATTGFPDFLAFVNAESTRDAKRA
jgi:hypothetical protein